MLKLLRKSVKNIPTAASEKTRQTSASAKNMPPAASAKTRQTAASANKNPTAASEKVRAASLRLHSLAIETERPTAVSKNGHPTFVSANEHVAVAFMETPVRYLADLPDLQPGDKIIREDGIIYAIAGDYDSLISPDGVYYDPITLMPYSDQEKAAVECEEYPMDNWGGLAMKSSRHRERFDDYCAEMQQKGQVVGENGYTIEQARRAEIEMRKFDKEDEEALQATHG